MDRFTEMLAFMRTAERGSQTAAASVLGITPAMVGRHVRALEARLGVRLLNRTTQRQSLTPAGAAFLADAVSLLGRLEEAEASVAARSPEPRGLLRVNGPMAFGWRRLAPAVAAFRARHPAVRVELTLDDRRVDVVEEGWDVVVRIGRLRESSLVARRLATCRLLLCAAPAYLARAGTPRRPADLAAHRCLLYALGTEGTADWSFADGTRVPVSGALSCNNGDALLAAALAGEGVLRQPDFIVGEALRTGALVALLPEHPLPVLTVHALLASTRHLPARTRAFLDVLVEQLRE